MEQDLISDIELFFTESVNDSIFVLEEDEASHAIRVLRKKTGDEIYATDGKGNIFKGEIIQADKKNLTAKILERKFYEKIFPNVRFYIPLLRNKDRLRFAVEKLMELGFTDFVFYSSERTIPKKINLDKIKKTAIAAMKQSLGAYLPEIDFVGDIKKFKKDTLRIIVLFDQSAKKTFSEFIDNFSLSTQYSFFIGPEGDFTSEEKEIINPDFSLLLTSSRLRAETAIISVASAIALLNEK